MSGQRESDTARWKFINRWAWALLLPILGWFAREVYALKVSTDVHPPTLMAAERYADDHDEQIRQRVQSMDETIQWMAATMESKWNVRRPSR